MLLVRDESGAMESAAAWNWRGATALAADAPPAEAGAFWDALEAQARVIDFETLRSGFADDIDLGLPIPFALVSEPRAWAGIPLIHEGRLTGLVLLGAPDYRRPLDWEDFDLLRTAGRQAASSLAEAHGQQALMNAQRFEEFNRRFAFILHDIKNLVSQLSLIARNAERHAGNPEFQADMVATLKSSVGKMNDLLARIAPKSGTQRVEARAIELRPRLAAAIAASRRDHVVELLGPAGAWVAADGDSLEQAVTHLVRNAVEASPIGVPVSVRVELAGDTVDIVIADKGIGMDSDFIRGRLFQPFASTKEGGFGVGAFEARSLVAAMGGRLTVESTPGEGSRFTIHLPAAPAAPEEKKSA
jgi:putative PEP-CTERM system histidine kinase